MTARGQAAATSAPLMTLLRYWLPPLVSGALALTLLLIGETPVVRAGGLALSIIGVGFALRRMGALLTVIGSLTLTLSPAFWSQSGGAVGSPATIVLAFGAATVIVLLGVWLSRRPGFALGAGILTFALLFWSQIGTPQSLRLSIFVTAWLLFLIIDMLLITNPRPDEAAPPILRLKGLETTLVQADGSQPAQPYHTYGILLLYTIGVLNDPLLTLLAPAVVLSLTLSRTPLPVWYMPGLLVLIVVGMRGIAVDYLELRGYQFVLDEWRHAQRWLSVFHFVTAQFTLIGVILAVLGLARLARWYPPLGVVTMLGYGAYGLFGLVYIGPDRALLLMPMLIIHITWMTYAVFSLGEWLAKSWPGQPAVMRFAVLVLYALLPLSWMWSIINGTAAL